MQRRGGAWAAFGCAFALIACACGGCVATASSQPPRGVVVNGPPPPPVAESRGAPPGPNATWVAGYWHWAGARYMWIPGHWESAPPGSTWYAPRYVSAEGAYYYQPGGWQQGPSAAPPTQSAAVPPSAHALH